jgi:heme-degrading monooxygenase HmoA
VAAKPPLTTLFRYAGFVNRGKRRGAAQPRQRFRIQTIYGKISLHSPAKAIERERETKQMSGSIQKYVAVWEFLVKPGSEKTFEQVYGPEGDWVRLFRRAEGHLSTQLYRDAKTARRYLTVDCWVSVAAYEAFRRQFAEEHKLLDAACEALTEKETPLGSFQLVGQLVGQPVGRSHPT